MFDTGLDGSGIVVGVSDTGIDMTHCQFYDANVSTPYDVIDLTHRKVVTYITHAGDLGDDEKGHGTHVASTAAGKSNIQYGDFKKYDGNAREAKIAFVDIGRVDGTLTTPGNLKTGVLEKLHAAGAKVSSHSWGSTQSSYTTDARNVDSFMVEFPDSLVLFAAGNDGITRGVSSVGSPSTNKNGKFVFIVLFFLFFLSFSFYPLLLLRHHMTLILILILTLTLTYNAALPTRLPSFLCTRHLCGRQHQLIRRYARSHGS